MAASRISFGFEEDDALVLDAKNHNEDNSKVKGFSWAQNLAWVGEAWF